MSYILDALKKAESERERGAVPGLTTAQANPSSYIHYGSGPTNWWRVVLAVGTLVALAAALWAWRQSPQDTSTVFPATPVTFTSPAAASPGAAVQSQLPALEAQAPLVPVTKPGLPLRAPAPVPAAAKTGPVDAAASTVARVQAKVAPLPASPTLPSAPVDAAPIDAAGKPAPSPAPIRSAAGGVPTLSELPDALRRQIPALNISGAIYSDSPAEWTLIINDQVMGKGSQVAPDVRLEEITASSAVFNFKGQRFRMER